MAVFKCKMCGASLNVKEGATVIECDYCGTKQTLPKLDDDKRANLYDRANHFRMANEYDKAMSIYEKILEEDRTDAEAYWSIVLCRYGIEYVEDPKTHKRIPTINRMQMQSILADEDYKQALEYADGLQKSIYKEEANTIANIQKGILAISQKEEPFDVFICYKETDTSGKRTQDSVIAQDLYYQLTQEGFKVFFARITLEDKLGSAYEPYIFAALNSSKVMVVLGTKPEHFNAVWVKNEWSRYLDLINGGANKMLIPAYKGMDPYDIPEELSHLQAQDMSKLGFMQDLVRGIKKIAGEDIKNQQKFVVENVGNNVSIEKKLERCKTELQDKQFEIVNEIVDSIFDIDINNAYACLYKVMATNEIDTIEHFIKSQKDVREDAKFVRAYENADEELKQKLDSYIEYQKKCKMIGSKIKKLNLENYDYDKQHHDIVSHRKEIENKLSKAKEDNGIKLFNERKDVFYKREMSTWVGSLIGMIIMFILAIETEHPFIFGALSIVCALGFIMGIILVSSEVSINLEQSINISATLGLITLGIYPIVRLLIYFSNKNREEIENIENGKIKAIENELLEIDNQIKNLAGIMYDINKEKEDLIKELS